MSILFMDSMQMYADLDTTANFRRRWSYATASFGFDPTGGPFGGGRWQIYNDFNYGGIYGDWNKTTIFFGGWVKQSNSEDGDPFVDFYEGNLSTLHLQIDQTSREGTFDIRRGDSGTILGQAGGLWKRDQWNFVEFKVIIHDSTGAVVIYVNGVEKYSLTGVDTRNGGTNGWVDCVRIGGQDSGAQNWSHVAIWDTAGDPPTDFFGPYKIYYLKPNADTAQEDFTPLGAGDQFEEINEQSADDDTSYNSSATATDADEVGCEDLPASVGTIYAVQATVLARKNDAGARGVKVGVDSNGTDSVSADQPTILDYQYYDHLLHLNPDDAAAWEEADVNACLLRYEVGS